MPVTFGKDKIGAYAREGDSGKKYYYTENNDESLKAARTKAEKVGTSSKAQNLKLSDINTNRTVMLFDMFYEDTSEHVVSELLRLDQENKEDINLLVNSIGGNVTALWAIIDTIDSIGSKVNTICLGEADSCGAVLLASGNKRYIGKNSVAMIHNSSGIGWGKADEVRQTLELMEAEDKKLSARLAKAMDQDAEFLSTVMKGDVYLNAEESVEMGLVDAILSTTDQELEDLGIKNVRLNSAKSIDTFILNRLKNKIENKQTKLEGETPMTKNELMAKLKDFDVDVVAMQNENKTLAAKVGTLTAEYEAAKQKNEILDSKIKDIEAKQIENEKESIVNGLITAKKATQATLEAHKFVASKMSLDEFKGYVEKLPVLDVVEAPMGNTNTSENSDNTDREDVILDRKIKAVMKERGLENNISNYMRIADELDRPN